MTRTLTVILLAIVAITVWLLPDEHGFYPVPFRFLVGQVFPAGLTPESAAEKYAAGRLRLLVVPGHDSEYGGAQFGRLKEADLTAALAARLVYYLSQDPNLTVFSTRDWSNGAYRPQFLDYFVREREAIRSFRARLRAEFLSFLGAGAVKKSVIVEHNFAPEEVSIRLYGINKWANEQGIDLALHLHFNDYAGRPAARAGPYRGFSIYIPERQLPSYRLSRALAEAITANLLSEGPSSNLPKEEIGIVEDQELIAVGANGSRDGASLLIEYGYIYEPRFADPSRRSATLDRLAGRTAEGVRGYFASTKE